MRTDQSYHDFISSDRPRTYLAKKAEVVANFRNSGPLALLLAAAKDASDRGDLDAIDSSIVSFLSQDVVFLKENIKTWMQGTADDKMSLPPFREVIEFESSLFHNVSVVKQSGVGVTVSSISAHDLEASRLNGEGSRVVFSAQKSWFKLISDARVPATVWECDRFENNTDFRDLRCWKASDIVLAPGDVLSVDGSFQSVSFGNARETAVFIQVENVAKDIGTAVAFDTSGRFVGTYPTDRTALRKMVMCSVLKHFGTASDLTQMPDDVYSAPFYLRWHFIREMVAASPERGAALLTNVVSSEANPSIRRAASATLQVLETRGDGHVAQHSGGH